MSADQLIEQIDLITTPEQVPIVLSFADIFLSVSGNPADDQRVREALGLKLKQIEAQGSALVDEFRDTLRLSGVEYPLTEWVTATQYAKQFNIKNTQIITNWISRGIIPADHVKDIPALDLRLIRAVPYETRATKSDA